MKPILLSLLIFSLSTANYAQVGIGTTEPHPSSVLDINSTNKGLLVPRVSLGNVNTSKLDGTNTAAPGLLIYNTNVSVIGGNGIGFYYWNGTAWNELAPSGGGGGSTDDWSLSGNNVSASNFLGTTNNKALVIKTNNVERTRITTQGHIEVLNTGKSIFLGQENGANDDLNNKANIFIGYRSGKLNRGSNNIIIGELGLSEDRGASSNIGIGKQVLRMNEGSDNIALGELVLSGNQNASSNIAIGKRAAEQNSGSNNIVLGELALSGNQGASSNIAIGKQAAQQNSGSYNIVLGESALSANRGASSNIVIGKNAGKENSGSKNIIIGESTLIANQGGSNNVLMGFEAGKILAGSNNTFLGYQAGLSAQWNINNSSAIGNGAVVTAANQIVLGNAAVTEVKTSGSVKAAKFISSTTTYPDYVFENYFLGYSIINEAYKFKTIDETEDFVKKNGHLPGVKSYKEIKENNFNIDMAETSIANLEKIEEQFLYIAELNTKLKDQQSQIDIQQREINELKEMFLRVLATARD